LSTTKAKATASTVDFGEMEPESFLENCRCNVIRSMAAAMVFAFSVRVCCIKGGVDIKYNKDPEAKQQWVDYLSLSLTLNPQHHSLSISTLSMDTTVGSLLWVSCAALENKRVSTG
jgi:hypothetical protein